MTRYRKHVAYDVSEDEALDENGVLRSGFSVSVPMTMRDASRLQRSVAEHGMRLHDGHGNRNVVGHRPGYIVADNAGMRDAKQQALDEYENWLTNAWRRGPEVRDARKKTTYEEEEEEETHDASTRDGMTLDELQRDHQRRMAREYQAYDRSTAQRWRDR